MKDWRSDWGFLGFSIYSQTRAELAFHQGGAGAPAHASCRSRSQRQSERRGEQFPLRKGEAVKKLGWLVGTRCSASLLGLSSRTRRSASLPLNFSQLQGSCHLSP